MAYAIIGLKPLGGHANKASHEPSPTLPTPAILLPEDRIALG